MRSEVATKLLEMESEKKSGSKDQMANYKYKIFFMAYAPFIYPKFKLEIIILITYNFKTMKQSDAISYFWIIFPQNSIECPKPQ